MSAVLSLIPELEQVVVHGSREKRVDTLQRVTTLFLHGAGTYNELHVDVFDDVFGLLVENVEGKARTELSVRLAPLTNAPARLLRALARDDDIATAGPVLQQSPRLREPDLVDIANTMGQAHQLAIASRPILSETVAAVLLRRGDPDELSIPAEPFPACSHHACASGRWRWHGWRCWCRRRSLAAMRCVT